MQGALETSSFLNRKQKLSTSSQNNIVAERRLRQRFWWVTAMDISSVKVIFYLSCFETCENRVRTKIYLVDLDSPCRILVCRGLRPSWDASACSGINFSCRQRSQADLRALDNIVLAHTSDILVLIHWFWKKYRTSIIAYYIYAHKVRPTH